MAALSPGLPGNTSEPWSTRNVEFGNAARSLALRPYRIWRCSSAVLLLATPILTVPRFRGEGLVPVGIQVDFLHAVRTAGNRPVLGAVSELVVPRSGNRAFQLGSS